MDQGTIVEPDDRRTWTPLRMLLIALGAIAGGVLLSIALGGPAHADSPGTPPPPAATSADTSLVGQVTGALSGLTRTAVAPVDELVATVAPAPAAGVTPPRPAPLASASASAGAIPAALDTVLAEAPVSSTPLWQTVVGPQPVRQLAGPLAVVLRPLTPAVADLLAPLLTAPPAATAVSAVLVSPASPETPASAPLVRGPGAPSTQQASAAAPSPARHVDRPVPAPGAPLGSPEDAIASLTSGGALSPAVLIAFVAALLLAVTALRRHGWILPSAPAFAADVSPD